MIVTSNWSLRLITILSAANHLNPKKGGTQPVSFYISVKTRQELDGAQAKKVKVELIKIIRNKLAAERKVVLYAKRQTNRKEEEERKAYL